MKNIALIMIFFLTTNVTATSIIVKEEMHNISLGGGDIQCVEIFSLWGSRSRMEIVPYKPTIGVPINSTAFYSKKMRTEECKDILKGIIEQNQANFYCVGQPGKFSIGELKDVQTTKIISLFSEVTVTDCHAGIREKASFNLWGVNFTGIADFEIFQYEVGFREEDACAKSLEALNFNIN